MAWTTRKLVRDLCDGDCFFYTSPEQWHEREKRILAMNEYRSAIGEKPLEPREASELIQATAAGYIVVATVLATGERVTQCLEDGKKHIWYDGMIPVRFPTDRRSFDDRIEQMKAARKKMEEEEARMRRPRSKKKIAPTEIEERTLLSHH